MTYTNNDIDTCVENLYNTLKQHQEIKDGIIKIIKTKGSILNRNPNENEQAHICIFNLNKIIKKLESSIELSTRIETEEMQNLFLNTYDDEFFNNLDTVHTAMQLELNRLRSI